MQNATRRNQVGPQPLLEPGTSVHRNALWFWSDQYDRGCRWRASLAGPKPGAATRQYGRNMAGASFSVYHFRASKLIAVDSVNSAKDRLRARKLLDAGISPTLEQAADPRLRPGRGCC